MKAVDLFKAHGQPFSTISVVTEASLDCPDEIFDFFYELRPERVAFSIEEAEGSNKESSLYRERLVGRVEEFFYRLAIRNFFCAQPLRIREIEGVLTGLSAPPGRTNRSQETELGWIVSVGKTGDVSFFSPELLTTVGRDGLPMIDGNLHDEGFASLLTAATTRQKQDEIGRGVEKCAADCVYFGHCGGGSPANKHFETGRFDVSETWYCQLAKKATVRGVLRAISDCRSSAH
jgi:uncharacterized protein